MASRTPSKPFKNQNSLDETDDGLPEEILNLRTHHKQAYGYITKALEIDEEEGKRTPRFFSSYFDLHAALLFYTA